MSKQNTPPYQRRERGLIALGVDVRTLIAPVLHKSGFMQADILSHWQDILGSALAQGIYPTRVLFAKGSRDRAVLHVRAVSGAYATEFQARSAEILERINTYFGYNAVADVRITQGAIPLIYKRKTQPKYVISNEKKNHIYHTTEHVSNPDLRNALVELGCLLN